MKNYSGKLLSKVNNMFNPYRGLTREIYIIALVRVVNSAGRFIFPLLTLILTKKVGMTGADAGLLLSASGIVFMLSSVIGGKLTDIIGRKKTIVIFNSIGASFYFAAAFMISSIMVVPCILLAGFIMGIADPASGALVADITTPKNRDSAYSLFYMAMNVGFAVSPIIGGLLFENYLWVLFIVDGITSFVTLTLMIIYIPETIGRTKEKLGKDRKLEESVEGSILKVLFQRPILIFYALVIFGYNFVYSQWGFLFPINTEQIAPGQGAQLFGTMMSFNAFIVIVLTPFITKLLSKKGSLKRIAYGGILYTLGFGLPGFLNNIPFMYAATFVLTLGEIIVTTGSMPFIANHTPASHRGRMNAVLPIIMGLGYTIGPVITGNISSSLGMDTAWKIVGAIMIIFVMFTFMLEKYDNRTAARAELAAVNE